MTKSIKNKEFNNRILIFLCAIFIVFLVSFFYTLKRYNKVSNNYIVNNISDMPLLGDVSCSDGSKWVETTSQTVYGTPDGSCSGTVAPSCSIQLKDYVQCSVSTVGGLPVTKKTYWKWENTNNSGGIGTVKYITGYTSIYLASGTSKTASYGAKDSARNYVPTNWTVTGATASCGRQSACSVTFNNTSGTCGTKKVTISAGGESITVNVTNYGGWTPYNYKSSSYPKNVNSRSQMAVKDGCYAYEGIHWDSSLGLYVGTEYDRCCSGPTSTEKTSCWCPTTEMSDSCAMVSDAQAKSNSSLYRYNTGITDASKCKGNKPEEEPELCKNTNIKEESGSKKSNVCEGEMDKMTIEHTLCGKDNYNKVYYTVTSKTEYKTEFDMNRDGKNETVLNLKSGESFTYTVKITSRKQIKGVFDAAKWKELYNPLNTKHKQLMSYLGEDRGASKLAAAERVRRAAKIDLDSAESDSSDAWNDYVSARDEDYDENDKDAKKEHDDKVDSAYNTYSYYSSIESDYRRIYNSADDKVKEIERKISELNETESKMDDLEGIVTYYNDTYVNVTYLDENEPEIKAEFEYRSDGKMNKSTTEFVKNEKKSKDGSIDQSSAEAKREIILSSSRDNARKKEIKTWNINYNNYNDERVRYLEPPEASIDKKTGEIKNVLYPVSGYARIYTDKKKVDSGQYNLLITIDKIGTENKESKIVNDKCKLNVKETELSFRVIDVGNPFISNSYTPGINWVNSKYGYNFKGIIDSGIWASGALSSVVLDNTSLRSIRSSNSANSYLGTCDTSSADSIVCGLIN